MALTETEFKDIVVGSDEYLKLSSQEQKIVDAKYKARIANVYDRTLGPSYLKVDLPSHMYGEWVHKDAQSITEKEHLGFKIDEVYAAKTTIGKSNEYIDVVHMVIPMAAYKLIEAAQDEEYVRKHGKMNYEGRIEGLQEYKEAVGSEAEHGLPPIVEDDTRVISGPELMSTLKGE